jgi:hypothetical protein
MTDVYLTGREDPTISFTREASVRCQFLGSPGNWEEVFWRWFGKGMPARLQVADSKG